MKELLAMSLLLVSTPPTAAAEEVSNPLIEHRADPQILRHSDGFYYFIATVPEYDRIELRRARHLNGLRDAEPTVLWRKHASGPMSAHIWAPELHRIDGKWYIYFAAGEAEKVWNIRMYVLENSSENPLEGEWIEKGQIKTAWDTFALDATTFEHRGTRYLLWAQHDPKIGGNTCLFIAAMDTPWSLRQPQKMLSKPEYLWEVEGFRVNEGPAVIERNHRIFVTYSASATDSNYCMGLLSAPASGDLLNPESWRKSPTPVFVSSPPHSQYGPGHNSFTVSEDGETDLLVYHARGYKDIEGDPLHNPDRHTRVQVLRWREDGYPDFGEPVADNRR